MAMLLLAPGLTIAVSTADPLPFANALIRTAVMTLEIVSRFASAWKTFKHALSMT